MNRRCHHLRPLRRLERYFGRGVNRLGLQLFTFFSANTSSVTAWDPRAGNIVRVLDQTGPLAIPWVTIRPAPPLLATTRSLVSKEQARFNSTNPAEISVACAYHTFPRTGSGGIRLHRRLIELCVSREYTPQHPSYTSLLLQLMTDLGGHLSLVVCEKAIRRRSHVGLDFKS